MRQSYFYPILSGSLSSEDYLGTLGDTVEPQKTVQSSPKNKAISAFRLRVNPSNS